MSTVRDGLAGSWTGFDARNIVEASFSLVAMKRDATVKPFRPFLVFSPPSYSLVAPRLPLRYGGIFGTMRVKRKKKKADFYLHPAPLPLPSPRFFSASFAENDGDTHHSDP